MPVWTIYVAHQNDVRISDNWGTARKWKKYEINEKVRQDSPPEFTATIEYDSGIQFNDLIRFDRDSVTQWVGFVEDLEIDWDQNSRYLLLGGRDLTYLLWRKYVENFNNAIKSTNGFFGNVNAVELTKFLLRTPRSDLPEVEDDSLGTYSIYPYNKEGWGIDISNFGPVTTGGHNTTISGETIGAGSTTEILEADNLVPSDSWNGYNLTFTSGPNSGQTRTILSSINSGFPAVMVLTVTSPFPHAYVTGDAYSVIPVNNTAIGYGDLGLTLLRKRDMVWGNSGSPNQASDPTGQGQVLTASLAYWTGYGTSPYIDVANQGSHPTNYIKSSINKNATAVFTQNGVSSSNPTGINSVYLTIIGASGSSWASWYASNCYVYIWVESYGGWSLLGNFGGKSSVFSSSLNWRTITFNCSSVIKTPSDLANARIQFIEYGNLSTFIQYAYLSVGYTGSGSISAGEWVNIQFNPVECMGFYMESRASIDQFPQNYHVTTQGAPETFNGYILDNPTYITEDDAEDTITFDSWQSDNSSKIAYFYRQGINADNTGPIGDFDETFAFAISSSESCTNYAGFGTPPAFVPFCLANQVADYSVIRNNGSDFTALEVLNINNVLSLQPVERSGGILQYNNNPSISTIAIGVPYYVHVTRVGSITTYSIYGSEAMTPTSAIYSYVFDSAPNYATYVYRYQAITFNQVSLYGTVYSNSMDVYSIDGERFQNPSFESGSSGGWSITDGSVILDPNAHSGNYDVSMLGLGGICKPVQVFNPSISFSKCTQFGFWWKCDIVGKSFVVSVQYDDLSYSAGITLNAANTTWNFENCLADGVWDNTSKNVINLIVNNSGYYTGNHLYLDDFACQTSDNYQNWTRDGGTASVLTNTTKQIEGSACQQVHCTANGQGHYFEENLPSAVETVRVDAWVRCPPPATDSTNHDILANNWYNGSYSDHWGVYGQYPYIRNSSNEDDNHLFVNGTQIPSYDVNHLNDYATFDSIDTSLNVGFFAVSATTNCRLNVSSRIVQNIGGTGSIQNLHIRAYLWVQHMNNGAGGWVQIGDSGTYVFVPSLTNSNASAWANTFATIDPSSYLSSMNDWINAKVKLAFYGSIQSTGDPSKAQFQVGQIKLHWDGVGSSGYVNLLKVSNSSVGPDPQDPPVPPVYPPSPFVYIAEVVVAPSEWASDHQSYMRFMVRGFGGSPVAQNGELGTGWTELPIPYGNLDTPNPWVKIGLYVNVGNGTGYITLYNITNWDGLTFDSNGFPADGAYLLCQLTGLTNNGTGLIDTVDYEAEYEHTYGNGSTYDTYLDSIYVYTFNVETHTVGSIFAGQGPEITLVTVTDNFYPDIIHSWEPRTMSNIKIYCDDNETAHGWEITQIYVYKTDIPKFRVTLDESITPFPTEMKMNFREVSTPIVSPYLSVDYNGTTITVSDQYGNVIISGTPSSAFYAGFFSIWATNTASFSAGTETISCDTPYIFNTQTYVELNNSSGGANEVVVYNYPIYAKQPFHYILDATHLTFNDDAYLYFAIDDAISDDYYGVQNELYGYIYYDDETYYLWVIGENNLNTSPHIFLNTNPYVNAQDTDVGLGVYVTAYDGQFGKNYVGTLLDYDNDSQEWRVDTHEGIAIPTAGQQILLYTNGGGEGIGQGILSTETQNVWAGGPYIYLSDANIDFSIFSTSELFWIGPANIPKNRLSDVLWDIATLVNDDYVPFEWWVSYPSTDPNHVCIGDFNMGPRRGVDRSNSVSFVTGTNMESVKYQRSSRDTYQRCQVIGSGEGKNQDDTSSFWQNDQDAMDEVNGFIEDIVTQKQVSGGRIANRYAKVQLKLDASPKEKNAITCDLGHDTYPSGTYGCGDDVALTDFLTGLGPSDPEGGVYRIWNLKVSGDENGEMTELTCQAPYLEIANIWKGVYKQLKSIGATGVMSQDWTGDGTATDKVSAEKLTDLFSVSAKNDVIDVGVGNTDPKWVENAFGSGSTSNWNSASGNLAMWGPKSGSGGTWVEAEYNGTTDLAGKQIATETVNIQMSQEPKFTTTFQVYQGADSLGTTDTIWNIGDYVDFGLFTHNYQYPEGIDGAGFIIRVRCEGVGIFNAYSIFCSNFGDYELPFNTLVAQGKAKFICGIISNTKYKAIIEVEDNSTNYGNALPEVVISISNQEITNPPTSYSVWTQFNTTAMLPNPTSFFNTFYVRPIYILINGNKASNTVRCEMFFYNIKCQIDVIQETDNPSLGSS
jgi:hypothetical protein